MMLRKNVTSNYNDGSDTYWHLHVKLGRWWTTGGR